MKKWRYLKKGEFTMEGDLWCGLYGNLPVPTPITVICDKVSYDDEKYHCFMRLVEDSPEG